MTYSQEAEALQRELDAARNALHAAEERSAAQTAALRESEELYRTLVENLADAVTINVEGRRVFVNQAFATLCGLGDPSEAIGSSVAQYYAPEDAPMVIERTLARQRGEPVERTYRARIVRPDGEVRMVETSAVATAYKGQPASLGVLRDVTERHRMEEQLLRAQRLETLGRIAGQVAHDLNNFLGPLVALPELVRAELPKESDATGMCDTMLEAALRIKDTVEDLRVLGKRGLLSPKVVDVNAVVRQAVEQLSPELGAVEVTLDLGAGLRVFGSQTGLTRVMVNLISNACRAMRGAGSLLIRTGDLYVDRQSESLPDLAVGEYVRVDVRDSGPGIPEEIRERVFEPFFTTDAQRGSGLGLSTVQAIVGDHHGHVAFETVVGDGTTFSVYLPATRKTLSEEVAGDVRGGSERILVVDDDELQRETIGRVLRHLGYQVDEVASGEEAVVFLGAHPVDLSVLDMVMKGIDGCETFKRLVAVSPGHRAIIVSGSAPTERVREAQAMGAGAFVRKPITLGRLAQAVRSELERAQRGA